MVGPAFRTELRVRYLNLISLAFTVDILLVRGSVVTIKAWNDISGA